MNLADDLERQAISVPDKPAIVQGPRTFTYRELDGFASSVAEALGTLGVGVGDRVAVLLPSWPEHIGVFYGVLKLGAMHVGINVQLKAEEVAYQLDDSGAKVAIVSPSLAHLVRSDRGERPALEQVLVVGGSAHDVEPGEIDLTSLLARQDGRLRAADLEPDTSAVIFYTSGTTGIPKGVVHGHYGLAALLDSQARRYEITGDDSSICLLPLCMLSVLLVGPCTAIHFGNTLYLLERYDPLEWAHTVARERVTYALGTIPTLYIDLALLDDERASDIDLSSLRFAGFGGSPIPPELRRAFEERYGVRPKFGLGGTEAPAGVAAESFDPARLKFGSVGFAYDHIDLRIVDEDDQPVAPGTIGEICTGPKSGGPLAGVYRPMKGYWGMPEATAEALRGGFLHWGDLGYIDEDGHLFVVDRKKDMIIRAGMNIYPAQIEKALLSDERVEQCSVIGIPAAEARLGEVPKAFVKLAPGASVTEEELKDLVKTQLARYNELAEVEFVDEFPRNSLGKILKRELRARGARNDITGTTPA